MLQRTREERLGRIAPGPVHTFDLHELGEELRAETEYLDNGRNGATIVKTADLRVVVEVLRKGADLPTHQAPGPITVQVIEGELRFECEGEVFDLKAGDLLALSTVKSHSVEAVQEALFVLTIAPVGQMSPQPFRESEE